VGKGRLPKCLVQAELHNLEAESDKAQAETIKIQAEPLLFQADTVNLQADIHYPHRNTPYFQAETEEIYHHHRIHQQLIASWPMPLFFDA
jgi:hypothetical protein